MFIGYQRSSHSLVGAILDAHPEIIIPHEYGLMTKIKKYQSLNQSNLQRYALFYDLHHLSMHQALFGIRARINYTKPIGKFSNTKYRYHVSGLWQGGYQKKIKVTFANLLNNFLFLYNKVMGYIPKISFVNINHKISFTVSSRPMTPSGKLITGQVTQDYLIPLVRSLIQ